MNIVFHTVPEGVPVYQDDVFFDGESLPSPYSLWNYESANGRLVAITSKTAHFG